MGSIATALNEHYLVVIGDIHELTEVCFSLINDLLEDLGPMAHLHNAHSGTLVIEKVVTNALKNLFGEDGGAGGEVVNTIVFHCKNSF